VLLLVLRLQQARGCSVSLSCGLARRWRWAVRACASPDEQAACESVWRPRRDPRRRAESGASSRLMRARGSTGSRLGRSARRQHSHCHLCMFNLYRFQARFLPFAAVGFVAQCGGRTIVNWARLWLRAQAFNVARPLICRQSASTPAPPAARFEGHRV
jgi:hypothetical protein